MNVSNIEIEGQYFENGCKLELLNDNNQSVVIYGKNGSGKTTISNAFLSYKNETNDFKKVKLFDSTNSEITVDKNDIWVFNEEFIDKNVKLSSDPSGINAIILFGEVTEIDDKISEYKNKIAQEQEKIKNRNYSQFLDEKNPNCFTKAREILKKSISSTWAIREQEIRNLKSKAPVKDVFIDELLVMKSPSSNSTELKTRYKNLVDKIKNLNPNFEKKKFINKITMNLDEDNLVKLLNKCIENKTNLDYISKIIKIIEKNGFDDKNYNLIVDLNNNYCPTCYQYISNDYKDTLKKSISIVFNAEIENYKNDLQKYIINEFDIIIDTADLAELIDNEILVNLAIKKDNLCKIIDKINSDINEKIGNVYSNKVFEKYNIESVITDINSIIDKINMSIYEYNLNIDEYNKNMQELIICNKELTYYDVISQRKLVLTIIDEMKKTELEDNESNKIISELSGKINDLNSKKRNTDVALDEINKLLSYVFSSSKRLVLKPSEDPAKYNIYSKGKKIRLNKLSVGERNIISLCYFFESIKNQKQVNEYFNDDMILVIDDPVSSFDYENRLGIISLLKKMCNEIIKGNNSTEIIFLTHEFDICIALQKILKDLNIKVQTKELRNMSLINLNSNRFSNYGNLLTSVFEFANGQKDDSEYLYGNIIRKALEAYSNFNYKLSIDQFLTLPEILNKIKDSKLKSYFESRMNKLLLNDESHTQDISHKLPDSFDFQKYSINEQIQTAKDILVFLLELDSVHIYHYLGNSTNEIVKWKNEILSRN